MPKPYVKVPKWNGPMPGPKKRSEYWGMRKKPKVGRPIKRPSGWEAWLEKQPRKPGHDITETQKQYLYYIRTFQYEERYSPSTSQIARFFGVTHEAAKYHLSLLVLYGYLEYSDTTPPRLMFPKGLKFPWLDNEQFPNNIFYPRD